MKFRFTIGKKIGLGFSMLIALTILAFIFTQNTLDKSRKINDEITTEINPSVESLEKLNLTILRSKLLITNWAYTPKSNDNEDKVKLKTLINDDFPLIKEQIATLSKNWPDEEKNSISAVFSLVDLLFKDHKDIMTQLNSFESYEDPIAVFTARNSVEEGDIDIRTRLILESLSELISSQRDRASKVTNDMLVSFNFLQSVVTGVGILLVLGGVLIAFFTVRGIVKRIDVLKKSLLLMSRGIEPNEDIYYSNDEIGEMSLALDQLIEGVKHTKEFAQEVGSGNFDWEYQPLSEHDTLGYALIKMRDDLRENERVLEHKVEERTMEVVKQKEEIDTQRLKLEYLYNQVTDSIKYAKRIQEAILPPDELVKKLLPDSFIFYKPKDIVSGDFYWMEKQGDKAYFAAVDCTGHGVPGAFMSIVGYNILKHVVTKLKESEPALILNFLNAGVTEALHQSKDESSSKDGMDICLCSIDFKKNELQYAGAFNPLWIVRENIKESELGQNSNVIIHENNFGEIKGDKFPIGPFLSEERKRFKNHTIKLQKGDTIYIFSDGYADQFGGEKKKKFMARNFRELLLNIQPLPMQEQKTKLETVIEDWRGEEEQVDDMLVIGVRV